MKKFTLIGFFVILTFAVFALAAALFWFARPDTHRAGLEQTLSRFFKADAHIGRLSWVWSQNSPGLQIGDFSLKAAPDAQQNILSAKNIRMVLDLASLFKKEFKVRTIRIESPELALIRTTAGLSAGGKPLESFGTQDGASGADFDWSVDRVQIAGGALSYRDETGIQPRQINLRSLDFGTQPGLPLVFEGRAGLLTSMPNMTYEGTYNHEKSGGWTVAISKLRLGVEKISVRALEQAFPELIPLGLRGTFVGAITATFEKIVHDGKRLQDLAGGLRLEGLKFFVRAFKTPFQNLNADIHFDSDTIVISSADGELAGGEFRGRGEVRNLHKPDPDATFEFRAERIKLVDLFPKPTNGRPQLGGRASIQIAGKVQGRAMQEWLGYLQGEGSVALADGTISDVNILRLIFEKLSTSLPGAQEAFSTTMSQELRQKLAMPDTLLAPMEVPFIIGNGGIVFPNFRIAGDGFEIVGSGQQGFGGDIEFRTTLILDQAVSSYVLYCCPDASAIADPYGRLSLPLRLTGTLRNVRVIPDTQYVIQKILSLKGPQYLMKALRGNT